MGPFKFTPCIIHHTPFPLLSTSTVIALFMSFMTSTTHLPFTDLGYSPKTSCKFSWTHLYKTASHKLIVLDGIQSIRLFGRTLIQMTMTTARVRQTSEKLSNSSFFRVVVQTVTQTVYPLVHLTKQNSF